MSHDPTNPERFVDEMAVALCGLRSLDNESHCVLALMQQGFRATEIAGHLDKALALARGARADQDRKPKVSA